MPGGQTIRADLSSHAQQRSKFYLGVAVGAGDGSASGKILLHEGAHHAFLEFVLKIHHVMRKIQMLRYTFCVVDIVERAATVLRWTIAL